MTAAAAKGERGAAAPHRAQAPCCSAVGVLATVAVIGAALRGGLRRSRSPPPRRTCRAEAGRQGPALRRLRRRRLAARLRPVRRPAARDPVEADAGASCASATVAIEDERFYKHDGVDLEGIVRAGVKNLESGETVQGGSTITQQLVRALYIKDPKRDFERKIREAKLASELEDEHSKRWILQQVPELGAVRHGRRAHRARRRGRRAVTFFAKHAKDLTLARVGAARRPAAGAVAVQPVPEPRRRDRAPQRGAPGDGRTTTSSPRRSAAEAMQEGLRLKRGTRYTTRREPYFFDYVAGAADRAVRRRRRTARAACTSTRRSTPRCRSSRARRSPASSTTRATRAGAIVSIDPETGYIRAMASSGTYNDRTFNLAAQGHRQPGSAFKTMVLTTAIRRGHRPATARPTSRSRSNLADPGQRDLPPWEVKTYDNSYGGTMDLVARDARSPTTRSTRSSTSTSGPKKVARPRRLLGITTKLDCFPAEGLGGLRLGVSPLEMANAYATLAAGGMRQQAEGDQEGRVPGRQVRRPRQARAQARVHRRRGLRGDEDPRAERARAAPARRRRSAARRPARPARPTTSTTRGSWATRRSSPRPCGSAIPNAQVRHAVHGGSAPSPAAPSRRRSGTTSCVSRQGRATATTSRARTSRPSSRRSTASYASHGARRHRTSYGDRAGARTAAEAVAPTEGSGYDPRFYAEAPQAPPTADGGAGGGDAEAARRRVRGGGGAGGRRRERHGARGTGRAAAAVGTRGVDRRVGELELIAAIGRRLGSRGDRVRPRARRRRGRGHAPSGVRRDLGRHASSTASTSSSHPLGGGRRLEGAGDRRCRTSPRWAPRRARPTWRWCCPRTSTRWALELVARRWRSWRRSAA